MFLWKNWSQPCWAGEILDVGNGQKLYHFSALLYYQLSGVEQNSWVSIEKSSWSWAVLHELLIEKFKYIVIKKMVFKNLECTLHKNFSIFLRSRFVCKKTYTLSTQCKAGVGVFQKTKRSCYQLLNENLVLHCFYVKLSLLENKNKSFLLPFGEHASVNFLTETET